MNIGLIYRVNFEEEHTIGVQEKMRSQQKAFIELGHECIAYYHRNGKIIKSKSSGSEEIIGERNYKKNLFDFKYFFSELHHIIDCKRHDAYYIRYPISTPAFINFLKEKKRSNIVIEVPTFPFDNEWTGMQRMYLPLEKYFRKRLKYYCKRIVHFGAEEELFGIPTIRIGNGIDVSKFSISQECSKKNLRMIAVGNFNYWHGLDRVIKGMSGMKESVSFKIVGGGEVIPSLKALTMELDLVDKISFHPFTSGKKLDVLFDDSNVGIGTLAIHRKKVALNSSLKHREYASRGLPFIYAGIDKDFENENFVKIYPESEETINILELKNWIETVDLDVKSIRYFAEKNLDWKIKLKKTLEEWTKVSG